VSTKFSTRILLLNITDPRTQKTLVDWSLPRVLTSPIQSLNAWRLTWQVPLPSSSTPRSSRLSNLVSSRSVQTLLSFTPRFTNLSWDNTKCYRVGRTPRCKGCNMVVGSCWVGLGSGMREVRIVLGVVRRGMGRGERRMGRRERGSEGGRIKSRMKRWIWMSRGREKNREMVFVEFLVGFYFLSM